MSFEVGEQAGGYRITSVAVVRRRGRHAGVITWRYGYQCHCGAAGEILHDGLLARIKRERVGCHSCREVKRNLKYKKRGPVEYTERLIDFVDRHWAAPANVNNLFYG